MAVVECAWCSACARNRVESDQIGINAPSLWPILEQDWDYAEMDLYFLYHLSTSASMTQGLSYEYKWREMLQRKQQIWVAEKWKKYYYTNIVYFFYIQGTLFANYFDTICNYVSFLHLKVKIIEQGIGIN